MQWIGRIARGIIENRKRVLIAGLLLCVLSGLLSLKVPINTDMTKYLPTDSPMKQGIDLLASEFSGLQMPVTIRVMFENLEEEKEEEVLKRFQEMEYVSYASVTGRVEKEGKSYTLITVTTPYDYRSSEELKLEHGIPDAFSEYTTVVRNDDANGMEIPFFIFVVAGGILMVVLFVLCSSFAEAILFLIAIGGAILLNMGTNLLLGSVSFTTWSISAILQLVLSMDYSIILMNRYRQEKEGAETKEEAMERALKRAFSSIASSGFTTLVGLLMLVFMRFRIGMDIGLVLAKGVFLSMICCMTILPCLILACDALIEKTTKPTLKISGKALAAFSWRFRVVLAVGFLLLFAGSWYLESLAGISYSLSADDPIAELFPKENQIVVLYENGDEEGAASFAQETEKNPKVRSVSAYSTTVGRKMSPSELLTYLSDMMEGGGGEYASMLGESGVELDPSLMESFSGKLNESSIRSLYAMYHLSEGGSSSDPVSMDELFTWLSREKDQPLLKIFIGEEGSNAIDLVAELMQYAREQLIGSGHSLMMISTEYPVESEETSAYIEELESTLREICQGEFYLIGNSVMNQEMKGDFGRELLTISLLTAASIFFVVLLTFRKLVVAAALVLLVQCGVFLTVATTWLMGYKMYYLALLIVQCILMGATVDYGILFANYYRELRYSMDRKQSLAATYERSMHTILTSSVFMILGTGAVGFSPADPTITQICKSISIGAISATLLVIFVLPGILAALDRFVTDPGAKHERE